MRASNVFGIIFSSSSSKGISQLIQHRTTASVPIGGKYRVIDFALSNMANSGINNVGIIAKSGYMSLMDHIGSGKEWDLNRKNKSVTILPPYSGVHFDNDIETLYHLRVFIEESKEDYILLTRSSTVINIDYAPFFEFHSEKDADVTVLYKKMGVSQNGNSAVFDCDETGRITKVRINPSVEGECNLYLENILLKKSLLLKMVTEAVSEGELNFYRILQRSVDKLKIYAYEVKEKCAIISSINEYFNFNMSLMDRETLYEFTRKRPVFTKVRDDVPCKYGLESVAKNSLIAKGCVIEGTVENSVISKGVHIGKGSVVKNCIIMQDTIIEENCNLNYIIIDKDVNVSNGKTLVGSDTCPTYIPKRYSI